MAAWDELRLALARLLEEQPGALTRFPDPSQREGGLAPFAISLAPWASGAAAELRTRFGDEVDLTVGALPYPPGPPPRWQVPHRPAPPADPLDPDQAEAGLDGPAVVRSGHTLRHGLLVCNRSGRELRIATNGQVTAGIVDPRTGEEVGGFSGAQHLPLIMFRIAPGATERIPLLIGTASFTPRLGYAVPPGSWGLQVTLDLSPGPGPEPAERIPRRTPVLPLTITALRSFPNGKTADGRRALSGRPRSCEDD